MFLIENECKTPIGTACFGAILLSELSGKLKKLWQNISVETIAIRF